MLAPAKINLALHITKRMQNGFHEIETIATFASFGDELHASNYTQIKLNVKGKFAKNLTKNLDGENIILKAARLLDNSIDNNIDNSRGARLELVKNLPVASGMGGGSANAAATICALCELWQLKLSSQEKIAIGKKLGADVPMCLHSTPLVARGIGDEITPINNMPAFDFVAVNCGQELISKNVFENLTTTNNPPLPPLPKTNNKNEWFSFLRACRNDMQGTAIKLVPEIAECIAALEKTGAEIVRMTGAGATVFALYNSPKMAQDAVMKIANKNWWVKLGKTTSGAI